MIKYFIACSEENIFDRVGRRWCNGVVFSQIYTVYIISYNINIFLIFLFKYYMHNVPTNSKQNNKGNSGQKVGNYIIVFNIENNLIRNYFGPTHNEQERLV